MKTFSSTTTILFLAVALTSSVSINANNSQCDIDLEPHTSAHPDATNYMFTRQGIVFGGPPRTTKCSGRKTTEYTKVDTVETCANKCAGDDKSGMRDGLTLLGYNYNCRTQKCDCLRGNERDNIENTVHDASGHWACYTSDHAGPMPTPSPTSQCDSYLKSHTSAHPDATNYMFTRQGIVFGGPPRATMCSGRKTTEYTKVFTAETCANKCASEDKSGMRDGLTLLGYNYDCHTQKCDCLRGNERDNIESTVHYDASGHWACYTSDNTGPMPTPSPTPAQCKLPNTATGSAGGTTYTFTREEPQGRNTSCDIGESFTPDQNIDSVEQCADKCARKSQMLPSGGIGSTIMKGFDYDCDRKECTCLTAPGGTNLREAVLITKRNMACYSFGGEAQIQMAKSQKYLRASVIQTWD